MLIGFYVQIVLLGTIGCVLYQCLQLTRNCYFHFCVQNVSRRVVLRWKTERDSKRDIPDPDLVCQARQPRHTFFFYSMAPKVKRSKKGRKDKAVKRKEEHKIKWNPNSAHKDERITAVDPAKDGGGNRVVCNWGLLPKKNCKNSWHSCIYLEQAI